MSSCETVLQNKNNENWVKVMLCLKFTKECLDDFADNESKIFHQRVLLNVQKAGIPLTGAPMCQVIARPRLTNTCSHQFCRVFLNAVVQEGIEPNINFRVDLKSTDVRLWHKKPWELAKLFIPFARWEDPSETDFSGIINFLRTCRVARNDIVNITLLEKVKMVRNKVVHSSKMEIVDKDFRECAQLMINLLMEPKISLSPRVKGAIANIQKIQEMTVGELIGNFSGDKTEHPTDEPTHLKEASSYDKAGPRLADTESWIEAVGAHASLTDDNTVRESSDTESVADSGFEESYGCEACGLHSVQTDPWKIDLRDQIQYITPQEVEKYIRQAGRSSQEIKDFVQWIISSFKKSLDKAQHLWMGYEIPNDEPVMVAMVDKVQDDFPATVGNFKVLQRVTGQVSDEGRFVSLREIEHGLTFSSDEQLSIKMCLAKHAPKLMTAHSNLSVISASKIKSVNHGRKSATYKEALCIVLYVSTKGIVSVHEKTFPTDLDHIPVDVREGNFITFGKLPHHDYHEQLKMGCQIKTDYDTGGTLGGFLQLEKRLLCLTCAHFFFNTDQSIFDFEKDTRCLTSFKKDVYQPEREPGKKIGHLVYYRRYSGNENTVGVDAALIEVTECKRYPQLGSFPDTTDPSPDNSMVYNSGEVITCLDYVRKPCTVVKHGAGTGYTEGSLGLDGTAVREDPFMSKGGSVLFQQLEICPTNPVSFAAEGDSGALVFIQDEQKQICALGLLVGGTSYGKAIVTPIWAVLKSFGLPLKLLSFEMDQSMPTDERLDRVEQKMTLMDTKIDQIDSRTTTTEQKIDRIGLQTEQGIQSIQQMLIHQQQLLTQGNLANPTQTEGTTGNV